MARTTVGGHCEVGGRSMLSDRRVILACVVDSHPRFWVELILWVLCVTRNLSSLTILPVVYVVGTMPTELSDWVRAQGVEIRRVEPLLTASPHCNKIIPFGEDWKLHPWAPTDVAVVDVDLFFLSDPVPFLRSSRFRAPPNNHNVPAPRIWRDVLDACGLCHPYRPGLSLLPGESGVRETHVNNICASFIVAPIAGVRSFAQVWEKWARWLLDNRAVLDRWAVHVDQVSFALAMEEMGEDVEHLPATLNAILHLLPELETPVALHLSTGHIPSFPQAFDRNGCLRPQMLRPKLAGRGAFNFLVPRRKQPSEAVEWITAFNHLVLEAGSTIETLE